MIWSGDGKQFLMMAQCESKNLCAINVEFWFITFLMSMGKGTYIEVEKWSNLIYSCPMKTHHIQKRLYLFNDITFYFYTPRKLYLWWGILFSRCASVCVRPSVRNVLFF